MSDRAAMAAEFLDITSAQMLEQPEPDYLHAQLILMALNAELTSMASLGLPIPGRQFGETGSPYIGLEEMQLKLSDPIYSAAIRVVPELGQEKIGHTVRINRPVFVDSTYDAASRTIPAGTTIPITDPVKVGSEQAQVTITRRGGPYKNGTVTGFTVDRFDAGRALHSMATIKDLHIKRDFHKSVNKWGVDLFDAASTILRPIGMTTDDSALTAGSFPMSYELLTRVQANLEKRHIPRFSDGKYLMVCSIDQTVQLQNDPAYQRQAEKHPQYNPLFAQNYVADVGAFKILKSATLTSVNNSSSVPINWGQAFGPGMVGCGAGGMPRTAWNTQDNFGENGLVMWLWYCGFEVLDDRFGVSFRTAGNPLS